MMTLRVVGSSEGEGNPYYLRHEFTIDQAIDDGFTVRLANDGYYYGNRSTSGGWTARRVSTSTEEP